MGQEDSWPSISIVMATYNGAQYLREQLNSIIPYISESDELVISDDGSSDATLEIIGEYVSQSKDGDIRLVKGPHEGVVQNFANAIANSSRELILFADQDDVWSKEKLGNVRRAFQANEWANIVLHDASLIDDSGEESSPSLFILRRTKEGFFKNYMRSSYYGCCMGVRREFIYQHYRGFVSSPAYDQYLGLCSELEHSTLILNKRLIAHRVHSSNMSKRLSPKEMLIFRLSMIHTLLTCK